MTTYTKKVWKLRTSVSLIGLVFTLGLLTPAALVVTDALAQPASQPTTTAPATTPATTPAATPTETPAATSVATPAATPAATGQQAWWQALLMPVLSALGLFVAAFLVAGLRKLVQLIEKKWSVDVPDAIEKLMYDKARWALGWAEEKAEKRLLYGDGQKTPGAEKLSQVVDMLEQFADNLGYGHEWQRDKIEALAEGVLHLERDTTSAGNIKRDTVLVEKKNNSDSSSNDDGTA